jgi:hypothetical protein
MSWFNWLKRPSEQEQGVPEWLAQALGNAIVSARESADADGDPRVMVRVAGMGCWYWQGINPTAERIARHTDLPPATCRKAARILADVLASQNLAHAKGRQLRRKTWVTEWEYQ